jgi:hypothetical protein
VRNKICPCREKIAKSLLLPKRPVFHFPGSCVLVRFGKIFLKIISLRPFVSILNPSERLDEISPMRNNALLKERNPSQKTFENHPSRKILQNIFNSTITLEIRKIITGGYCVAVEVILDENGNMSLVIYNPLKKKQEIISIA